MYSSFWILSDFLKKQKFSGIPRNSQKTKIHHFSIYPIKFEKKSTFFSSNSSLITNLPSEFSKTIQKYEKSRFYHSKILKTTEKHTNLKKSQERRSKSFFFLAAGCAEIFFPKTRIFSFPVYDFTILKHLISTCGGRWVNRSPKPCVRHSHRKRQPATWNRYRR